MDKEFARFKNHQKRRGHVLPGGAKDVDMTTIEGQLGVSFPSSYRRWLSLVDGAQLFRGRVVFWSLSELSHKNAVMQGGWFTNRQLFFAESDDKLFKKARLPRAPEYFYFDLDAGKPDVVRYFSATPTEVASTKKSFPQWLRLVDRQKGLGVYVSRLYR